LQQLLVVRIDRCGTMARVTVIERIGICLVLVAITGCEFVEGTPTTPPEAGAAPDDSDDRGTVPAPWVEVWRDDFEGPEGSAPDPSHWTLEVTPKPANMELEYYTDRRDNTFLDGKGHLVIQALRESYMGSAQPFTSGRLDSHAHADLTYGRFEARLRVPPGQGLWPAFWLLGSNIDQVGWPKCGELDILEEAGSHPSSAHGTAHGVNATGGDAFVTETFDLSMGNMVDSFHLFAVEWTPDTLRWFVDDRLYQTRTRQEIEGMGITWLFDHPFFMILNLAVGGFFDGPPGKGTAFPARMVIDRVTIGQMPGVDAASGGDDSGAGAAAPDARLE
jgi:beta-glucanase (GH16 family)